VQRLLHRRPRKLAEREKGVGGCGVQGVGHILEHTYELFSAFDNVHARGGHRRVPNGKKEECHHGL
jgi:hypothetical protein